MTLSKKERRAAALKGWKTRRKNERVEAALLGWERRRRRERAARGSTTHPFFGELGYTKYPMSAVSPELPRLLVHVEGKPGAGHGIRTRDIQLGKAQKDDAQTVTIDADFELTTFTGQRATIAFGLLNNRLLSEVIRGASHRLVALITLEAILSTDALRDLLLSWQQATK